MDQGHFDRSCGFCFLVTLFIRSDGQIRSHGAEHQPKCASRVPTLRDCVAVLSHCLPPNQLSLMSPPQPSLSFPDDDKNPKARALSGKERSGKDNECPRSFRFPGSRSGFANDQTRLDADPLDQLLRLDLVVDSFTPLLFLKLEGVCLG